MQWLTYAEAEKEFGVSRTKLKRIVLQGRAETDKSAEGVHLIDGDGVARALEEEDGSDVGVLRVQVTALKAAQSHAEQLLKLVTEPAQKHLELLQKDLQAARERIAVLEASRDELVATREAMLSQAKERELAEREAERRAERRDRILRIAETRALPLLDKYLGSGKADIALELLDSLDPVMVQGLAGSGLLTPKQQELLAQLLPEAGEACGKAREASGG